MLTTTLVDAKRWRDILGVIFTIVDEAEFIISPNGMRLKALDPSRVAMIDLDLSNHFFDRYECDKPSRLRFKVKTVLDILDPVGSNESLDINYSEEQAMLVISLKGDYLRTFNLNTLVPEGEADIEPQINFQTSAKVSASSLKKVIVDSKKIGDHITIQALEDRVIFRTIGLGGNAVSTFVSGEEPISDLVTKQESKATYSLDLLEAIVKNAASVTEKIQIEFATDQPLKLDMLLPQSRLQVYMSPRIEEA
jgi:proliferating cell nuclear antigen